MIKTGKRYSDLNLFGFRPDRALQGNRKRRQSLLATGPSLAWFSSLPGDVCDASDGQSGPTGLMARAESLAGFAVKIFVK